jgi:K(+)-stimulated pyrophosphate-energized sodium pump
LIKVMNLVSLLVAPLIIRYADDTGIRITIAVLATAVLAFMIWYSKSRRVELLVGEAEERGGGPPLDRSPLGEVVLEPREVSEIASDATKRSSP